MNAIVEEIPDIEPQLNMGAKIIRSSRKNLRAAKAVGKYVAANAPYVKMLIAEYGLTDASKTIMDQMKLDGCGAVLDDVSDNLLALVSVIVLMAVVPYLSWRVVDALNTSGELPAEWTGGMGASTIWVIASSLVGAIVVIALVSLVLKYLKGFSKKRYED